MAKLWPWIVVVCGVALAAGTTEPTNDKDDQFPHMGEFSNDGVWRFTCDEYCSYCGGVGEFAHDLDKCVCSFEPGATDWDCMEDVRQTKEFLGLNYTLEIREIEANPVEEITSLNPRVQRQIGPHPSPRRRPMGRRSPRPGRGEPRSSPNPVRPNRRRRERRPFRRQEPLDPTSS